MSSHNCRPQAKDYLECRMQKFDIFQTVFTANHEQLED